MSLLRELCISFLAFMTYSVIGWAYESTIWAKAEKKMFLNRGMLLGPLCPIYGIISLLDWQMLHRFSNPVVIFFFGGIVCCVFEYFVSWSFEKIFHQRWWDYSNYPLNLNGRISVPSGLFFGAAGLFLVKIVHPFTTGAIGRLPDTHIYTLSIVLASILLVDIIVTSVSIGLKNPPRRVRVIYDSITHRTARPFDYLNEAVVPFDKFTHKQFEIAKDRYKNVKVKVKNKFTK